MLLAVQMYTLREYTKTAADFYDTLNKVAAMGYPALQLSAVGAMNGESPAVSAVQAKKALDDAGLRCIATHRSWDDLLNNTGAEIEFHQTLCCDYVAVGSLPPAYLERGAAGYAAWASDAVPLAAKLKAAGLRLGYHNHAFEFAAVPSDYAGASPKVRTCYDILIEAGSADLALELDTYWVAAAGANPATVIARCAGRLPVVHVKDMEVVGNEGVMAPVGEGNLDWDGILRAFVAAGTESLAVEQDTCRRDPFDCLRSSYEFLQSRV